MDQLSDDPSKGAKKKSDQSKLRARLRDLEFFTEVLPDGVVILNNLLSIEATNESAQSMNDSLTVAEPDQQVETDDVVGSGPGRLDIRV